MVEETERALADGCRKVMILYGGLHMQVRGAPRLLLLLPCHCEGWRVKGQGRAYADKNGLQAFACPTYNTSKPPERKRQFMRRHVFDIVSKL